MSTITSAAPDEALRVPKIAADFDVDRRVLYREIHAGRLTALRIGGQWRVRRSDLDDYLNREAK